MRKKPTDLAVEEPNNLTIAQLRERLGDKDVTILLGRPEEDYGVVIAQGRGLGFIIQAAQQHETHVSDYAQGIIDKMAVGDAELDKTINELKNEIPGDGIAILCRNNGGPEDRLLSIVATGEAAEVIFHMLDAHGVLDSKPDNPGAFHSAQA